jgi:D-tyrosyl-tRNA(Tyr) deacylase
VRALLQRVTRAEVRVEGAVVGRTGPGLLVLLGVGHDDDETVADGLARRTAELRIFGDEAGRTNRSLLDVGGGVLAVSQFTLYADTRRGRRPGFTQAAEPGRAATLFDRYCRALETLGIAVGRGRFGASMEVELVNDGPFTIWLESAERGDGARTQDDRS